MKDNKSFPPNQAILPPMHSAFLSQSASATDSIPENDAGQNSEIGQEMYILLGVTYVFCVLCVVILCCVKRYLLML